MGTDRSRAGCPESLDGGKLGPERKLYCRELIARFGHALALNWNIGEENTQSTEEIADMVRYLHDTDPYRHLIVIHTFPNQQDKVYTPLLGNQSELTGASLQNGWNAGASAHAAVGERIGEGRQAVGRRATTSRTPPDSACRPTSATRAPTAWPSSAARRRRT